MSRILSLFALIFIFCLVTKEVFAASVLFNQNEPVFGKSSNLFRFTYNLQHKLEANATKSTGAKNASLNLVCEDIGFLRERGLLITRANPIYTSTSDRVKKNKSQKTEIKVKLENIIVEKDNVIGN